MWLSTQNRNTNSRLWQGRHAASLRPRGRPRRRQSTRLVPLGIWIGIQYYPHADQIREASRLQLLGYMGAMQLDSAKTDAKLAGDDLVGLARGNQLKNLT